MVALKKDEVEIVRNKSIKLFATPNILVNDVHKMLDEYKKFYTNANILNFLHDEELVNTALSFFDNNLNISLTSKKTFMHRNTLVYRIEKIKKILGLDIRIFSEAVIVGNMVVFYRNFIKID